MENSPVSRRISENAQGAYMTINRQLTTLDPNDQASCPLSLSRIEDVTHYHKWVFVPVGGNILRPYTLQDFRDYAYRYRNGVYNYVSRKVIFQIPDPMRTMPNLRYMWKRMERLAEMPSHLAAMPIEKMTQDFKAAIAREFFSMSKTDMTRSDVNHLAINCGISVLDSLNLIHKNFAAWKDAETYLVGKSAPVGSYLVRLSTQGNATGSGECTLFTITMVLAEKIQHIRFMDVHGVGVYLVTPFPKNEIEVTDLNRPEIMSECKLNQVLAKVEYQEPHYACVLDVLGDLEKKKYIQIADIIPV